MHRALTALALLLGLAVTAAGHSPHDVVNQVVVGPRLNGELVVFARVTLTGHALLARSFDSGRSWTVGGLPVANRGISDIALSPSWTNQRHAFVGTLDAGLLKSTDGGRRWFPVEDPALQVGILSVTLSPDYVTDGRVLATTVNGAYVSLDGGASWLPSTSGLVETRLFESAWVRAGGGQRVLFAGEKTLHRSDDDGATWTPVHVFDERMNALEVSPRFASDGTLIVSLRNGAGVFVSTDGGATFDPMVAGLTDPIVNDVDVAVDGTCFAVARTDGLFRADGPGASWEPVGTGWEVLSDLTFNHFRSVTLSPSFGADDTVFVGTFEGLFRSRDRGDVVRQLDLYGQGFNRRVVPVPTYGLDGQVYLVNYGGGPYRTAGGVLTGGPSGGGGGGGGSGAGPAGQPANASAVSLGHGHAAPKPAPVIPRWTPLGRDITALFGQELVLSPRFVTDRTLFYAQISLWKSRTAGEVWKAVDLPPAVQVVRTLALSPGYPDDPVLFMGAGLDGGSWRSDDGADTWTPLTAGLPPGVSPTVFEVSPDFVADRTVFLGSKEHGVFRSTDAGDTWTDVSATLGDLSVRTLDVSPAFVTDGVVLVGTDTDGVWRSSDGGLTFAPSNEGLPVGPSLKVEGVALSPAFGDDGTAFVATLAAGVHRSVDGGLTWTEVGPGLPEDAPRTLAVSPAYPEDATLFVSTYDWVYRSRDGGQSFQRMPGYTRIDDLNLSQVLEQGVVAEGPADPAAWRRPAGDCVGGAVAEGPFAALGGPVEPGWNLAAFPRSHGEGVSLSVTPGDAVSLEFKGRQVRWCAPLAPDGGIALVSVDEGPAQAVSLYAPVPRESRPLVTFTFEEAGWHTIRVEVTGQAEAASSGVVVRSDGFDYVW